MPKTNDPIAPVAARFSETYLPVDDGAELRLLRWQPESPETSQPLLFIAGWISIVDGWAEVLRALAVRRPLLYLETREKSTARLGRPQLTVEGMSVQRMADDLVSAWQQLQLADSDAVLFGSSLGSNAIVEALKHDRMQPHAAFLVGPNSRFQFPWWSPAVLSLPAFSYNAARHFVIWYLRSFRVNTRADPAQMRRYVRTVKAAEPVRLKLSARAVRSYRIWPNLETISTPVGLAYAPTDTLHGRDEVEEIAGRMPNGRAIPCPSNTYMHTAAVIDELQHFLDGLSQKSR